MVPNIISGTGGSTITLTADQTSESRTANVTVSSEVLTTQTIIVTQNAGLTGLEEVTGNPDLIFPNPTNGIVKITCKEASDLSVYDLQGQLLVSKKLKIIDNMIDINQLPTGIYVIKIISGNKVLSAKIIKE